MENMVQITRAEFENLLKAKFDLEMAKDALLNNADIGGWSKKYLTWGDEATSTVIRYIIGDAYDKKLEELTSKEDDEQ